MTKRFEGLDDDEGFQVSGIGLKPFHNMFMAEAPNATKHKKV